MELRTLTPDLPALLSEMGVQYNPGKLADALKGREVEISARAVKVATTLGACIVNVVKVSPQICWQDVLVHKILNGCKE